MIRIFLIALFLMAVGSAQAAAPVPSLSASRTSCTAPCGVHFDATGTTDSDVVPFSGLLYRWTFGDPAAGNYNYGANTSASKNYAEGPLAVHVFESAGVYTVTLTVCDTATTCAAPVTQAITVYEPTDSANGGWSQANTLCFYQTSGSSNCPNSGTEAQFTQAGFEACTVSGKRCLLQAAGTYTRTNDLPLTDISNLYIGRYGVGADPINTGTNLDFALFSGTSVNITITGIDFRGSAGATDGGRVIGAAEGASVTDFTLHAISSSEMRGVSGMSGVSGTWGQMVDTVFSEIVAFNNGDDSNGANAIFFSDALRVGVIDCSLTNWTGTGGEHGVRMMKWVKIVISGCTVSGQRPGNVAFSMRGMTYAAPGDESQYGVITLNKLIASGGNGNITIAPSNEDTQDERQYDIIVERNYFVHSGAASNKIQLKSFATRLTARNNIFDQTDLTSSWSIHIPNAGAGGAPTPADSAAYHNTFYGGITTPVGVVIGTDPTATIVMNNLMYSPGTTAILRSAEDGTDPGTQTPNSSDAQARDTNPFATTPSSADFRTFRPSTTAYADQDGTAAFPSSYSDFFFCRDNSGAIRYGAMVPTARAQCAGAAQ